MTIHPPVFLNTTDYTSIISIHGMQGGLRSNRQSYISMHSGLRSNKQSYVSIHRWEPSLGIVEYQKYYFEISKIFILVLI